MTRKLAVVLTILVAAAAFAGEHHMANAPTTPSFERMKSLVGEWKANVPGMGEIRATYTLHSDGGALLEQLLMPGEMSMITVYTPNGQDLAMTHYCSSHNQPHMVARAGTYGFVADSVANLSSKDAEHMSAVSFDFKDADHFTATWVHSAGGKEQPTPFNFTRVR
ncbi:MAG TPA: hypothetical protein VLV78_01265 [Thermoanaerobaculia bacterium]|nr:hypothetical protein [Thermoanaerobaculia bacterium]